MDGTVHCNFLVQNISWYVLYTVCTLSRDHLSLLLFTVTWSLMKKPKSLFLQQLKQQLALQFLLSVAMTSATVQ